MRRRLPLMAAAAIGMGACVWGAELLLAPWLAGGSIVVRGLVLAGLVGLGVALFVLFTDR